MTALVADTSALVSLGTASNSELDPLAMLLETYDVSIPEVVQDELREIAGYNDSHGAAATAVISNLEDVTIVAVDPDEDFPLDKGENAAVTLANELAVDLFYCDEFNRIGLVHASLSDTRLLTTPTLLSVFVRTGRLESEEAVRILDRVSDVRSWEANSYVSRARSLLE